MTPLTDTLRALADPTRREIVRMLGGGDVSAGEISSRFSISAPSVSHHLGVLKGSGLVRSERKGQTIVYSLEATVVQEFLRELLRALNVGEENVRSFDSRRERRA